MNVTILIGEQTEWIRGWLNVQFYIKKKMVLMGLTLDITLSRSGYVMKILCG